MLVKIRFATYLVIRATISRADCGQITRETLEAFRRMQHQLSQLPRAAPVVAVTAATLRDLEAWADES